MGVFKKWLTESLISVPSTRSETTSMQEKVELAGGIANLRQLVDEYREKAGENYSMSEDPLFMSPDDFRQKYSKS